RIAHRRVQPRFLQRRLAAGPCRQLRTRCLKPAFQRLVANHSTCRGPLPLLRARTTTSSTANPVSFNRRVNEASAPADQTASTPPFLSAVIADRSPRSEYNPSLDAL